MTTDQILIVCLTALMMVTILSVAFVVKSAHGPGHGWIGKTLVIHTRKPDDQSIRGTVHALDDQFVVLRDVLYLDAQGQHQPAGGLITVPRSNISNWQELPAAEAA